MKNRSAPEGSVVPYLIYDDVGKAIKWLCGAFGFSERLRAAEPDGKVGHAQLKVGEGSIMLGASRPGFRPPRSDEANSMRIHVHVEDVDRHFERAKKFGALILSPPTDFPYGERQYSAEDLAGYRWGFSQSIADVGPEEWGAIAARHG